MVLRCALSKYSVIVMVSDRKNTKCGTLERTFIAKSLLHTKQRLWLYSLNSPCYSESVIWHSEFICLYESIFTSLRIHLYLDSFFWIPPELGFQRQVIFFFYAALRILRPIAMCLLDKLSIGSTLSCLNKALGKIQRDKLRSLRSTQAGTKSRQAEDFPTSPEKLVSCYRRWRCICEGPSLRFLHLDEQSTENFRNRTKSSATISPSY